jgi:hypothetical protein
MKENKKKKIKKYKRRFNSRLVKHNLSYSTQEVADLLKTTLNTVNNWYKRGLKKIDNRKPHLVFGEDLIMFLNGKNNKRKQKCAPNELYCCKCKLARKAWENTVDLRHIGSKRLVITGLCEVCGNKVNKLAAIENIEELKKTFNIQVIQNEQL